MKRLAFVLSTSLLCLTSAFAWDYEGHRLVNELALESLPKDFPAFVKTGEAKARIAFLAGEPDRWRNTQDLNHFNTPDHYIDFDSIPMFGLDEHALTPFRFDFTAQLGIARAQHPEKFPPLDAEANKDHTRQLVGFLPWAIMENYDKLKSEFSYLKAFQKAGGTPVEIANAQQDIIYTMGIMGHFVGDAAQPLHTTKHFNGWVGENPQSYTREKIHSRVDGYFKGLDAAGFAALVSELHPAVLPAKEPRAVPGDLFQEIVNYIIAQNQKVIPLYALEKEGTLFGKGEQGTAGKVFLSHQLIIGGQMLGDLWFSAWQQASEDTYLEGQLNRRKLAEDGAKQ